MPGGSGGAVSRWRSRHAPLRARREPGERPAPDPNSEYLLYQTLLGIWPLGGAADDPAVRESLRERVAGYLEKATREAKGRTSWTEPNEAFERAVAGFLRALLLDEEGPAPRFRAELGA